MRLYFLTNDYNDNVLPHLAEAERKKYRPYAVVTVELNGLLFAIPLRSNIYHIYRLKTGVNAMTGRDTGLDFSKALVVDNSDIDHSTTPQIDNKEQRNLLGKEHFLLTKFTKYLNEYIEVINKQNLGLELSYKEQNLVKFSTLKNFHEKLGL
jgi:protein AbiQ